MLRTLFTPSGAATLLAGTLTAFTVSLVGAMPVGEFILLGVVAYVALGVCLDHRLPGPLLRMPLLGAFLALQAMALFGYVFSDFYRGSSGADMARGWARMVFLALDLVAVAFLFGRSPRNYVLLVAGLSLGDAAFSLVETPLFGDYWKFGFGIPVTVLVCAVTPRLGLWGAGGTMLGLGAVHFVLNFRSMGLLMFLVGSLVFAKALPRRLRPYVTPAALGLGLAAVLVVSVGLRNEDGAHHDSRSNISRSSMIRAVLDGVQESPVIGHGSWFSRSHVMAHYIEIRNERARLAGIGGFDERELGADVAIHSQILVALGEGGILGGSFFLAYGALLLWGVGYVVFVQPWNARTPLFLFTLTLALWHLAMSPFSGAHRVSIAMAAGLILLLWREAGAATGRPVVVAAGRVPARNLPRPPVLTANAATS